MTSNDNHPPGMAIFRTRYITVIELVLICVPLVIMAGVAVVLTWFA